MIGKHIGDVEIVRELGRGGMGTIFEGFDRMLERRVAVKVIHPELGRDPALMARFQKEAQALARLNHPHVTSVFSFLRDGEELFLIMEYVEGEPLDDLLRRRGALPWPEAVRIAGDSLDGLAHAHRHGIVHRDVKPGNLMLATAGGVKVMDFGIAHVLGQSRMTRVGNVVGTIAYMSPEQIAGREIDVASDLYSMGIVLYEMVTGAVPFRAESDFALMRAQLEDAPPPPRASAALELPPFLEQAILRALAKDPGERFASAADFAAVLRSGTLGAGADAAAGMAQSLVEPAGPGAKAAMAAAPTAPRGQRARNVGSAAPAVRADTASAPTVPLATPSTAGGGRFAGQLIPLATAALLAVAVIVAALALIGPGRDDEPDDRLAAIPAPVATTPVPAAAGATMPPPPPQDARPTAAAADPPEIEPPPSPASPPPSPPPPSSTTPPTTPSRSSTPPPSTATTLPPPSPPATAAQPVPFSEPATTVPEPAPSAPIAPPPPPPAGGESEDPLYALSRLAESLQVDSNRLLSTHRAMLTSAGRWPPRANDRVVRDRLESLEKAADRLQKACDVVADRERADVGAKKRRLLRKVKARGMRITGISREDRATLWQRADEALLAGRRAGESMAGADVDTITQAAWRRVRSGLQRLEQLER